MFGTDAGLGTARQLTDIGEHFRLRSLYEREAWADLQTSGLDRYLDLHGRIGRRFDPPYARWEVDDDRALTTIGAAAIP